MKNKYYVILLALVSIISIIFITTKIDTNNNSSTKLYYKINSADLNYKQLKLTKEELTKINNYLKKEKFDKLSDTYKCMPIGEYKIVFSDNELVFDGDDSCIAYLKERKNEERQVLINDDFRSYVNNLVKEKGE